jgi:S-disulfanyl-L-cysteine oxidoreductase SoxD
MPKLYRLAVALSAGGLLCGVAAATPPPTAAAGQAGGAMKSARDGVYTRAQATRGQKIYGAKCAGCHPLETFTEPIFLAAWSGQTAHALFTSIRTTMPPENPGGLPRQEYADILAYLLHLNKLPAGDAELGASDDALKKVLIEPPAK